MGIGCKHNVGGTVQSCFAGGLGAGFFSGLDAPKLMSRNFNPLRTVAPMPIPNPPAYFAFAGAGGTGPIAVGSVSPFRMVTAPGGSGLSAFASRMLTCHICVSLSTFL